jgi:hypothetical protein
MKSSPLTPILWLMALIMTISLACTVGASPTATQVPVAVVPTNTQPPPPTATQPPPPPIPTNTQEPPTPTTAPATEVPPPPQPEEPSLPANCVESSDSGYITCYDDTGSIVMDVPDYWLDVNGGEWDYDGEIIGVAISAAPNLADFNDLYQAEGVFFGASDTFARIGGYVEFLDYYTSIYVDDCDLVGRYDYNDGVYRGKFDQYQNCGGRGGYDTYVLSAVDIDDQFSMIVLVMIQVMPGDTFTVDQIWNTFLVLGL